MPSLQWNRCFGADFIRFSRRKAQHQFYGDHWGVIEERADLTAVRKRFLDTFVADDRICLEVGSGGGRWTRYLLTCKHLYCVELNAEMLDYIRERFGNPTNLTCVTTSGDDLPGVPLGSVDFVFSYGTFVHLEQDVIARYVASISAVMRPGANIVLQVSNSEKEHARRAKPSFSLNTPQYMHDTFARNGIRTIEIDNNVLLYSTIIRGTKA